MRRLVLGALVLSSASCNTIESRRRSTAPLNASDEFPCERYGETSVSAVPTGGRCIVPGNVPYDFTILVNAPETSSYAAGHAFVLTNADLTVFGTARRAKLPVFGTVTGAYAVGTTVVRRIFDDATFPDAQQSLPIKAVYVPLGKDENSPYDPALPLDVIFASSRRDDNQNPPISFVRSLPVGRWLRVFEPSPPWDATFPPFIEEVDVKRAGNQLDLIDVNGATLDFDDVGGTSRDTRIVRAEGLEDWTAYLRDQKTGRRISTLKTLCAAAMKECSPSLAMDCCTSSGTEANTRLDTLGRGTLLAAKGPVDAVVAPPAGWVGVPTYVAELLQGGGRNVTYPDLRQPVALEAIVAASAEAGVFLAVASRVSFESVSITLPSGDPEQRLRYSTAVSTDDRGRLATVVPPGRYRVTVEPLEGTDFATFRTEVDIEDDRPITLSPPRRTRVRGVALLTDGRAARNAEVVAVAAPPSDTSAQATPRPARTTVREDGTFEFDLDQGSYVLTVIPEDGTGFARVVTRATIPANEVDVGAVRIPPPTRLGLQIVDPTTLARPIPLANVRIFASPQTSQGSGGGPLLEVGNGMTDSTGRVEILLAQQPK